MSVTTGRPKPLLVILNQTVATTLTISSDLGILSANPTNTATYTLPALDTLIQGAFLWINNASNFTITVNRAGTDTINGGTAGFVIQPKGFATFYTTPAGPSGGWFASGYSSSIAPQLTLGLQNGITNITGVATPLTIENISTGVITASSATVGITGVLPSTASIINAFFGGVGGSATVPLGSIWKLTLNNSATDAGGVALVAGDGSTIFSPNNPFTAAGSATGVTTRIYHFRLITASSLVIG